MEIIYQDLQLDFPYKLEHIEDIEIGHGFSEHPRLRLKALVLQENAEDYMNRITFQTEIKVSHVKKKKSKTIFTGYVTKVSMVNEKGLHYLYIDALGATVLMDMEKKSRTFFKKGITYKEIIQAILKDYKGARFVDNVGTDRVTDFPIIQYKETDWEFLKRIVSMFEAAVLPSCKSGTPNITLGRPEKRTPVSVKKKDLETVRDLSACYLDYFAKEDSFSILEQKEIEAGNGLLMSLMNVMEGPNPLYFTALSFTTREYYPVGTMLRVNQYELMVSHVDCYQEKDDICFEYILRWPEAIKARYEDNPNLAGTSLVGTVKDRKGNMVSLNLEIDKDDGYDDEREDYYFTYALETKAFYCMPVKGAKVHLYFPTGKEWEAIAINSLRSTVAGARKENLTAEPSVKSFSNDTGSALKFSPDDISLSPDDDGVVKIHLGKDGSVNIEGTDLKVLGEDIIIGKEEISSKISQGGAGAGDSSSNETETVQVQAGEMIFLSRMQGSEECLTPVDDHFLAINGVTQLCATGSILHETSGPPVSVTPDYDDSELIAQEKADAANSNAKIASDLLQRKKEADKKFGRAMIMGALGLGLIFVTGGAAAVVVGAGLLGFGAFDTIEAVSSKNLALKGDLSTEALNPLKKLVPDPYYTMIENGLIIAGSIMFTPAGLWKGINLRKFLLKGSLYNTAFEAAYDFFSDGKFDVSFTQYLDSFSTSLMINTLTVRMGSNYDSMGRFGKFIGSFSRQFAASILTDLASGNLSDKTVDQAFVREGISATFASPFRSKKLNAAVDVGLDTALDSMIQVWDLLDDGKDLSEFDFKRMGNTAIRSSVLNYAHAIDPVNCSRGNLYYYKLDLSFESVYGEVLFERRYDSILDFEGSMGKGFLHSFETFATANCVEEKNPTGEIIKKKCITVMLPDTHIETFIHYGQTEDGNSLWLNEKGNKTYTLTTNEVTKTIELTVLENKKYRKYYYDIKGRLIAMQDQKDGGKYQFTYEKEESWTPSCLLKKVPARAKARLSKMITPGGQTLSFTYESGYLKRVTDHTGRSVTYDYEDGRLVRVHYPTGGCQEYIYDNRGRLITMKGEDGRDFLQNEYDEDGRVIRQCYTDGTYCSINYDDRNRATTFTFSESGRKEIYHYDANLMVTQIDYGDGIVQKYAYDKWGNKILETDKNGNITKREFNEYGQVLREELPDGYIKEFIYNENQLIVEERDNAGRKKEYFYNERCQLLAVREYITDRIYSEVTYTRDYYGRPLTITDANKHVTTYEYDLPISKPTRMITAEEEVFDYTYDALGRRRSISSEYGTVKFNYSETGFISHITDALGNTTRKVYDATGNLIKLISPNAYDPITDNGEGFYYRYDTLDRLIETKDPDGAIHRIKLDMHGHIIKEINPNYYDVAEDDGEGICYEYDQRGNRIKEIRPDGGITRYITDGNGNIVQIIRYKEEERKEQSKSFETKLLGEASESSVENPENADIIYYQYNSRNRLTEIRNSKGEVVKRFLYDLAGRLCKEINGEQYKLGKTDETRPGTLYFYDNADHVIEKRVPVKMVPVKVEAAKEILSKEDFLPNVAQDLTEGSVLSISENNDLKQDRLGTVYYQVTLYEYDKAGNKIKEKQGLDYVTEKAYPYRYLNLEFTYDKRNRLIKVSDSLGAAMEYTYDSLNQKRTERARINENKYQLRTYQYDPCGRLAKVLEAVDHEDLGQEKPAYVQKAFAITTYDYDKNGNVTKIRTPEGYEINRTYDLSDRIVEEVLMDKENGICKKTIYTYDKAGNTIREIDGRGYFIEKTYDAMNRLIKMVDKEGGVTRYFYDKVGNIVKVVTPDNYEEARDDGRGMTFSYDEFGRITSVRNALGYLEEHSTYNLNGEVVNLEDALGTTASFTYDLGGRRERVNTNAASQSYTYDARGNITGITDGEQNTTRFELDEWGRITTVHKPDGSKESYCYDYAGNITATTDGNGNTIKYEFNSMNRLAAIIDQVGEKETFVYDKQGRVASKKDRNGTTIQYRYNVVDGLVSKVGIKPRPDIFGEVKPVTGEDTSVRDKIVKEKIDVRVAKVAEVSEKKTKESLKEQSFHYKYDEEGQLIEAIGGGVRYNYDYTPGGRVKTKYINGKPVLKYTYTKGGKVKTITDITGKVTEYEYDPIGRVTEVKENGIPLVHYAYNMDNTLSKIQFANNIVTEYTYDKDKNYASIRTVTGDGEVLMEYSYEYDGNGNLITRYGGISIGTGAFSSLAGKTSYSYDSLQRIASATYADGFSESFTYDGAGNRIKRTFGDTEEVYRHDSRNRLLDKTLLNQKKPEGSLITFYQYDRQGNTLSEVTRYLNKEEVYNRVLSQSPYIDNNTGDWDNISKNLPVSRDRDNAAKDYVSVKTYEYDVFQKATKITVTTQKQTNIQENFYDAEGFRYAVRENDRYTGFITNGWSVTNEVDESWNSIKRLVRGFGIIASEDEQDVYHYYHQNEHGDTELITGVDGKIQNAYSYDVFGNIRTSQELIENRYTYYGEQYDKISEQYYLRARFYNPAIARFTQEDEYRGDGLNLYAYCANNPVMYVDPSGYLKLGCDETQTNGDNQNNSDAESSSYKRDGNIENPSDNIEGGSETLNNASSKGKQYTPDQQAVIELAKDAKKSGGVNLDEANILLDWADEYGVPAHGPEVHPDRPGAASNILHFHIGKTGHIPIKE